MKTIYAKTFFILVLFTFHFSLSTLYAQVPQAINFQAIARDGSGNPMINTNLQIRLSVVDSAAGGTISYQELRALQTNAYGSFSFQIGVNPNFTTVGTMQGIDWTTGSKFLKIDYDPTNTFTFNLTLGTIEFVTVPYAFAAESVVFIDASGAQDGDVLVYNSTSGKFEPSAVAGTNYTAGTGISIVGNTISNNGDLSDNNEIQALLLSGATLSLSNGGGSVTLPTGTTYTAGTGISIAGNTISATDVSATNELQTLSISNDTLYLSNGGYVKLPSAASGTLQAPTATTLGASSVQSFEATLNGTVNAHNLMTSVVFEWGTTSLYGNTATVTQSPVTGTSDVAVSYNLTGLQSATTYHFRIKAQNAVNVVYSSDMSFTTANSAPQLTTTAISSILAFSASSGGNVTYDGGSPVTERGLCWSTSPNPTTANTHVASGSGSGTFTTNLTGLTHATTYYVRAYATNAVGTAYGNEISFTTANSAPQLTTTAISSILAFSASSGGNVTYDGGSPVTERGLCWSTSPNPTTANTHVASGSGSGTFTTNLTGLTHATTYYVRAYATNAVGTAYGNEISFTTLNGVSTLTTTAISSITGVSAVSGGNVTADGGTPVTAKGVCWSTTTGPTTANSLTNDGSGNGSFTSNLTSLSLGTTYYVRAYATNAVGTTYGNERSFTTVALPTVTTSNFSDVKGNSAKAGGTLTNNGGSTITAQGLCWSTSPNPTTANSITTSFTAIMTGLSPNTTYYVRAYATNVAGTGYGNQISFNSGYVIGSSTAGGLVFYNDGAGHGLVCAETDQSTGAQWGCQGTAIGGTSTAINTGAANTNAIVAGCATAGIAARLCYDLTLNAYTDWYLPSTDELNLMYLNLKTQSLGNFADAWYWSSSEFAGDETGTAWKQHFSDGGQNPSSKYYAYYVRAVRAF